jgi:hypothetical protein
MVVSVPLSIFVGPCTRPPAVMGGVTYAVTSARGQATMRLPTPHFAVRQAEVSRFKAVLPCGWSYAMDARLGFRMAGAQAVAPRARHARTRLI